MNNPQVINIEEYGTTTCQMPMRSVERLLEIGQGSLTITPEKGADMWTFEANHLVGTIRLENIHIYIRPKIGIQNVLALMECGSFPGWHLMRQLPVAVDKGLLVAVCQLFMLHLTKLLEHGLQKGYSDQHLRVNPLRGRIDFVEHSKMPWQPLPAPCRYEEYDANTWLNGLLLLTLERLVVMGLPETLTRQAFAFLRHFGEVQHPKNEIECVLKANNWVPSHIEKHYEPAIRLATLILQKTSLNSKAGQASMATFLINMNRLVEDFIRWGVQSALKYPLSLVKNEGGHVFLDLDARIRLNPDLIFRNQKTNVLVGDVKYKSRGGFDDIDNSDIYQLASYCTALGLPRGVLITCLAKERHYDTIKLRNVQTELAVYPLNLGVPSESLVGQLERLTSFLTEWANLDELAVAA